MTVLLSFEEKTDDVRTYAQSGHCPFKFSGYQYFVRCSCMSIIRIHLKISEQMSKSGFFPSRAYAGRDSGFSKKIGRIVTKSGCLDSL